VVAPLTLGVDVGLTGVRACVVDAGGTILGTGRRPYVASWHSFGRAERDPGEWIVGIIDAGRQALATVPADEVRAVGVSALGPAPLLVDDDLRAISPALLFSLDRRAERERQEVADTLPVAERHRTYDHALPKLLWWQRNHPEVWRRAAWALDATGFVVAQLTGVPTMDAITAMEYRLPGWDCPVRIPDPLDPLAPAGGLSSAFARELGLPAGIPVAAGTYDSFVDIWAAGVRDQGDSCCLIGSTVIVCQVVDRPVQVDGLLCSAYPGEGILLGGWTLSGGLVLDWGRGRLASAHPADELNELAAALEPGDGGLLALPYLSGERTPIWDFGARGALIGISLETSSAQLYRALVDAVSLSVRDHAERLAVVTPPPARWLATGGGSSNRALVQAISDAVGSPLDVVAGAGEGAGPARLALGMLGIDPGLRLRRSVEPDLVRHSVYDELYVQYRALYGQLSELMTALSRRERQLREGELP
jgi:xylulokinase